MILARRWGSGKGENDMRTETLQKQIVLHDILVTYYEAGENKPGTPAIVFLHGWRSQGSVWFPVWEKLLEQGGGFPFALYALDLPGFGKSETPRGVFTLADYASVAEEFIKKLGLTEVVLVGHSFGGRIGIKVASAQEITLQKLVLVGSAGFRSRGGLLALKRVVAKIVKPLFLFSFMQPVRRKVYSLLGAQDYTATPKLQKTFIYITQEDLTSLLPQITLPTLLVWGEDDCDTPVSFGERMRDALPNAKLVIFKNAGHFCFLDQTDLFVKEFSAFLSS